ncbi:MAG: H-X9-DG-CTERM domain-containing protein [Planctomycetaceae bacterium]
MLSGYHPGVVQATFVDGSVRSFSSDIKPDVLSALLTRGADDDPSEF